MPVNSNTGNTPFACMVIGLGDEAARLSLWACVEKRIVRSAFVNVRRSSSRQAPPCPVREGGDSRGSGELAFPLRGALPPWNPPPGACGPLAPRRRWMPRTLETPRERNARNRVVNRHEKKQG